jgi:cytochrome c biogenesis protein CcdA
LFEQLVRGHEPAVLAAAAGGVGLLSTALVLGIRHGFDWDHIAAIADITSTSAAADVAESSHASDHRATPHEHGHGGASELQAHAAVAARPAGGEWAVALRRERYAAEQRRAILLGTLYALGHATVVALLGLAALAFGRLLPSWIDPIMARIVGLTLVILGAWVFVSLFQYARHGTAFRLRSRWLLVFDGARMLRRRFGAWWHGHEHVEPLEMSSYGPRTAFAVGMVHGIGAETGTQILLIAAIGGAAGQGLGVPMLLAFVAGLLVSNTLVVVVSATGFIASQARQRIYIAIGVVAGTFSLVIGLLFLFQLQDRLPDLGSALGILGT